MIMTSLTSILEYSVLIFVGIFTLTLFAAAAAAVYQEGKIWKHPKLPSLTVWGMCKVFGLNLVWFGGSAFFSLFTVLFCFVTLQWSRRQIRRVAHTIGERWTAQCVCRLFLGPVEIRGLEHLPDPDLIPAPVYVANHDSMIDIAAVYSIHREWRWIAKSSTIFLPGVGQIMYLSHHVWIDRRRRRAKPTTAATTTTAQTQPSSSSGSTNQYQKQHSRTSARNLYLQSNASIQEGVPMFFFPQGTRRLGERLPFKDGAFKVATENRSLMVPISIEIPLTAWNSAYPLVATNPIVLTIHKPIPSADKTLEEAKQACYDAIYSVLPDYTKQE